MTSRRNLFLIAGALILMGSGLVMAQAALSTIRGTVTDQSGAIVPGVQVTITEVTTNITARTIVTDDNGNFEAPDLKPGTYRLTAELPGFKNYVADNILLESAQIRRIDPVLEIGEATQEVMVEAGAAVITTEGGSITSGIESETYKDVPLVDIYPGPLSMLSTLPGVQGTGWVVAIGGQSNDQITQANDGVVNDRSGNQGANMNMYEEVKVTAVNNTADQSRVASYNAISKSGNNSFHGEIFYKHVNSALNSREFFQPEKPVFLFHEWQAEASGPIFKDRTFFYAGWFSERFPAGSFERATVPTFLMRQGDFSQFDEPIIDPLTKQPFPNNIIPANRLNPTSLKVQELYLPQPNLGGADALTNNLGFDFPYPTDKFKTDILSWRIDHKLTENNSIFYRYISNDVPYVLARDLPAFSWTRIRSYSKGIISDTHVFSPAVVNTFRFGWNGNYMIDGETVDGWTPPKGDEAVAAIGLQGVNPSGISAQGFPRMDISGMSTLFTTAGGIRDDHFDFHWEDSLTWATGRHVWKFGAQLMQFNDFEGLVREGTYGRFRFDGRFTNVAYADFLLGLPFESRRLDPLVPRQMDQYELGLYFMDSYKLTPDLTIDYGLRWDYIGSPTLQDGLQYNWDTQTGNVIVPEGAVDAISPLYPSNINIVTGEAIPDPDTGNFRPRIGVAYRLADDLVIRGGYGVFTERIDGSYFDRVQGGGPFEITETYRNQIVDGQPLFSFPNPFPATLATARIPSQSISGYPLQTDNGSIHQFNLSIEKELADIGLRASYIGSRSRGLNYSVNVNKPRPSLIPFTDDRRPFPQFVNASEIREDGSSNYDALQFEANKRVGAVTFNGHYTFAGNLHNFLNRQNPYDITSHWSHDDFSQRHRAVITTMIDLPWGRGRRFLSSAPALLDHIVGGWQLSTISYFATGPHFSPEFDGSDPSNTDTFGGLPDRIADGNLSRDERSVERWFDPSAFVAPPEGRFGNSGLNVLVAPGLNVHHLSLAKLFNIGERFRLTYTIGASNLFNNPHFRPPRSNISTPDTGELFRGIQDFVAEKHAARRFQMKLRLEW
ncbi:MAG: TonB-dependent receptor domain-containing protein [Acidobacteriota bacterium]